MPIWFYGWMSAFSGTQIYNFQLYSAYNVFFTSLPIIWFTTWDKEYKSKVLLSRPSLYKIGLENIYFNKWVFWRWFFYATWQGILMVMIIFYTLTSQSPNYWGKIGGMQSAGSFIFTCIVIVVNMKLLISSYEITIYLLFLVLASIAVYIAAFWFLSYYSAVADDFGVFGHLMTFTETYWTMFFFCFSYVLIDAGLRYASVEINQIYMKRMEI